MKLRTLIVLGLLSLAVGSCSEWEDYKSPALGVGECEIKSEDSYTSENKAQTALGKMKTILADDTNGGVLYVIRDSVYVSSAEVRKDKVKDRRWSYQVVFECDGASLHYEKKDYDEEKKAKNALHARINALKIAHPNTYKQLSNWIREYEYEKSCSTCCDDNGENCSDCNCSTDYHYEYRLRFLLLNPDDTSDLSGKIADWYDSGEALKARLGFKADPVDSLKAAHRLMSKDSPLSQKIQKVLVIIEHLDNENTQK